MNILVQLADFECFLLQAFVIFKKKIKLTCSGDLRDNGKVERY